MSVTQFTLQCVQYLEAESNSNKKISKAALSRLNSYATRGSGHHTMLLVLPAAVLLLITALLPWSDQAALSSTSRDVHKVLRPLVCAHTIRLRSIIRNWRSRSLPPASKAVSWPVALQSAGCIDTCRWTDAVLTFVMAVAPLLTVHGGCRYDTSHLAAQLALRVHRALCKCPILTYIYTRALSQTQWPVNYPHFYAWVCLSVRGNWTEFRHSLRRLLSHLYRQQALHILLR